MRLSGRFHLGIPKLCPRVITNVATILCALVPLVAQPQAVWNSQMKVTPQLFDRNSSSIGKDAKSDQRSAAYWENDSVDVSEIQMGVEAMVQAEIPPVSEGPLSAFPTMFNLRMTAPLEERAPRAASVTVGELAVPGKAYRALQKASQAFRKGRWDEAQSETTRALMFWPQYSDALVLSSLISLQHKRGSDASAAAEQAVAVDRTNGMAYVVLASTFNFAGQYEDALRALESALRFRPDAWQAYFERARAKIGTGDSKSGLMDAMRAEEIAPPKTSVIHFLKGAALLNLNRTSDALIELHAYLKTNPAGATAELARMMIERFTSQP